MPRQDIERFCAFAGISTERFFAIAETFRNLDVWQRDERGRWHIPDFLIPDWTWS